MVWSEITIADIQLPNNVPFGSPGSIYIGGPLLPTELTTDLFAFQFGIIWFPSPASATIKYFYYAFSNSTQSWAEGYCDQAGVLHSQLSRGRFSEDLHSIVYDSVTGAKVGELLFSGSNNPSVLNLTSGNSPANYLTAQWLANNSSKVSYITDNDPKVDNWISVGPITFVAAGVTFTMNYAYCVTYDRQVTFAGNLTCVGTPNSVSFNLGTTALAKLPRATSPFGMPVIFFGTAAGVRTPVAGFLSPGGILQLRGTTTNPNAYTSFEFGGTYPGTKP